MKDYTHKQEQNLFTDEERTKMGLHSREALSDLARIDGSYRPSGLGTDADKRPVTFESWARTVREIHSAISFA